MGNRVTDQLHRIGGLRNVPKWAWLSLLAAAGIGTGAAVAWRRRSNSTDVADATQDKSDGDAATE